MQCKCGGETASKEVIRKGEVVTEYQECVACTRVYITKMVEPERLYAHNDQLTLGFTRVSYRGVL